MTRTVGAAILAGGQSTRFGSDKAQTIVAGRSLLEHVSDAFTGFESLMVVGAHAEVARGQMVPDRHPGAGPLGGVITALEHSRTDALVVVGCDLPALTSAIVDDLAVRISDDEVDLVVPLLAGRRQWHVAAWNRSALGHLRAVFDAGERSMRRAATGLRRSHVVYADAVPFTDVDSPEELDAFLANHDPA